MASDEEVDAAMAAFKTRSAQTEGMESEKALRASWRAAIDAAHWERTRQIESYRKLALPER